MQHDARSVANQIIGRMRQSGRPVTPMQALKLAYYCHAWMLGLYRRPLLKQPVEAWCYGPVVPEIYDSLRRYGGEAIMGEIELEPLEVIEYEYDDAETDLIDQVCQKYGHLLPQPGHRERIEERIARMLDGPWQHHFERAGGGDE